VARPGAEPSGGVDTTPPHLGPLLFLVGVEFEARHLARWLRLPRGLPGPPGRAARATLGPGAARATLPPAAALATLGPGAACLPRLAPALSALDPAGVLVVGLAGGCAPDLRPGDLVIGEAVGPALDGAWLAPDRGLAARTRAALGAAGLTHRSGRILTVPRLAASPEAKAECWQRHGALAVDMESAHVLAWAREAGLPALALRAVADGPRESLPPALLEALDPAGRVRPLAVLAWLARPGPVGAAWRLWRRSRRALDQLARALAALTPPRPGVP
jgi:adenosylhomocysteine nucleosidase